MASRSSLRSQNIFQSHLSLGHSLMIECFACLWMLFLFSNAKNYPGFTELGSLAKIYFQSHLSLGVTLIVSLLVFGYYSCFPMLVILLASHSSLRSQHIFQSLLSLDISLMIGCFACRWMLFLFSNARNLRASRSSLCSQNVLLITLVVGCFSEFEMLYLSLDAILVFECYHALRLRFLFISIYWYLLKLLLYFNIFQNIELSCFQ